MDYDSLLSLADSNCLTVKEKDLQTHDGLIDGNRIAIRKSISTTAGKACALSEEICHHKYTVGDILDQSDVSNRKQELLARTKSYEQMVGLAGLVSAFRAGCTNRYEAAEHLGVTEEYLEAAVERYRQIYGACARFKDYVILFEPGLGVMKATS